MDLKKSLRPLTVSMAILGLYHEPRITNTYRSDSGSRRSMALRSYCLLTLAFLWFTLLRYIPSFWVGFDFRKELLVDRVSHVIWFAQCTFNATALFVCFENPSHMSEFLRLWDEVTENNRQVVQEAPNSFPQMSPQSRSTLATVLHRLCPSLCRSSKSVSGEERRASIVRYNVTWIWTFALPNIGLVVAFVFGNLLLKHDMGIIICAPFPATIPVEVFFIVLHFYNTCAWLFPLGFGNTLCAIMQARFSDLTRAIQEAMERSCKVASLNPNKIKSEVAGEAVKSQTTEKYTVRTVHCFVSLDNVSSYPENEKQSVHPSGMLSTHVQSESTLFKEQFDNGQFLQKVECFRRTHLLLCSCVNVLDRTMCRLLMITYTTTVPLLCFILYELITLTLEPLTIAIYCFYAGVNVLQTVQVSIGASRVHEAAHSSLEHLYFADVTHGTPEQTQQLNLFISKLTGTSVGFTVLGIVTVRKEMFTLAGLIVTYFFLILQYQIN